MKRLFSFIVLIFLLANVSSCSENQIDINSASLEELDELYGIGPTKAQAIIDARNYESVDELVNANGIGETTLAKIKEQGLACVQEEKTQEANHIEEKEEVVVKEQEEKLEEEIKEKTPLKTEANSEIIKKEIVANSIIELNPKDIKIEEDSEELSKQDYAIYGLIGFCIVLGSLYAIKFIQNKKYQKNEFE